MNKENDPALEHLLELNGVRYVIDEILGLSVKFEVKQVSTKHRKQGIRYSLSLHDRTNQRIMGFDNSHAIEYDGKRHVAPKRTFDHWHFDSKDKGQPYKYSNAAKLLTDFWREVDNKIKLMKVKL
jgi:hypothetical protein